MSKVGKLKFYELEIETILGVYDYEKVRKNFLIDMEIQFELGNSYYSDKLDDTIDTDSITSCIRDHVFNKNYNLLEFISYDITQLILGIEQVRYVQVTVYKKSYKNIQKVGCTYEETKAI